jgi:hypothetical protein
VAAEEKLTEFIGYEDKVKLAAGNLFKAHKQAIGELLTRGNADRHKLGEFLFRRHEAPILDLSGGAFRAESGELTSPSKLLSLDSEQPKVSSCEEDIT